MDLTFSAKIHIIGINPYVSIPNPILAKLFIEAQKSKGAIPVKGTINGKAYTQTVVKYQGEWRLYINGIMRKAATVTVGDTAYITIAFDPTERKVSMHPLFKKALNENKKARAAFYAYPPSRQKEINRYLNNIKTEETRLKNINRIVMYLQGNKVEYFVLLRNKS